MKPSRGALAATPGPWNPSGVPRSRRPVIAVLAAVAIAASAGTLTLTSPGRRLARNLLAWPRLLARAAERSEPPFFSRVAASQVGYGSGMAKRFSSPRPFEAFRVLSVPGGDVAFTGGEPVRRVAGDDVTGPGTAAWIGDFTPLTTPGRYRIVTDAGLASEPFDVGPAVFDAAFRAVLRGFYFQRAFTAIDPAHALGPWVHESDAALAPPGVRGGWHDAGDFSLYSASTSVALFWLLEAWRDFRPADDDLDLPESGNGVPDLLDEARVGLEWLLSVQDRSGAFAGSTCQERYGPYGTNTYSSMPPYRAGEPGALATARAVGTLASAAEAFRPFDAAFAGRCLDAALTGQRWLEARPGDDSDGPTCPAYRRDGDRAVGRSVRAYAAAGLLVATGDARYRASFEAEFDDPGGWPRYLHMNALAALLYLRAPAGDPARRAAILGRLRSLADLALADGAAHPFERSSPTHWGSIGAGFTRAGISSVRMCLADPRGSRADCEQALANVHYALGRNGLALSYVSGLPGVSRGREGGFHHWLAALRASPHDFPGMVAGGPNSSPEPRDVSRPHGWPVPEWGYLGDPAFPRDAHTPPDERFTDNDSWSTNEIALDWQASAVYALAFARAASRGPETGAAASHGPGFDSGGSRPHSPALPRRSR